MKWEGNKKERERKGFFRVKKLGLYNNKAKNNGVLEKYFKCVFEVANIKR